jgi:hypothetical protein
MAISDDQQHASAELSGPATSRPGPLPIEREAGTEASLVPGPAQGALRDGAAGRPADAGGLAGIWLAPLGLALVAAASFVCFRGTAGAPGAVEACAAADWRTELTLDRSRPELAMTTLRSRNAVGPAGLATCVDVSFACRAEGPYFELRLASPTLQVSEIGPMQIRNLNDELAAQAFAPGNGPQAAIRVADKDAVELIAYAIANSLAFRIPITFSDGATGLAEFKSYHFSTAVRPVLFACNMRSLQLEQPSEDAE